MTPMDWTPLLVTFGFVMFWALFGVIIHLIRELIEQWECTNKNTARIADAIEKLAKDYESFENEDYTWKRSR